MSARHALILAVHHPDAAPATAGAIADAVDLARALLENGVAASNVHVLTAPALPEGALPDGVRTGHADIPSTLRAIRALADRLATDDDTALLHFSGAEDSLDGSPALRLSEGHGAMALLAVGDLLAPLTTRKLRSVLVSLDTEPARAGGSRAGDRAAEGADPILTPIAGQPREIVIEGERRGLLSWALARAIRSMPRDPSLTLGDLHTVVDRAMGVIRARAGASLLPATKHDLPLGAFADPGPAHVPWRGVHSVWQFEHGDTDFMSPTQGRLVIGGPGNRERWLWQTQPWPTTGFSGQVTSLTPQPVQTPYNYTNNGFSGPVSSNPPQIGSNDRIFQVDVPGAQGEQVWLIVRNVQQPTAMEWYTTATVQYLPVSVNDILTFTYQTGLPSTWSSYTWYRARETP